MNWGIGVLHFSGMFVQGFPMVTLALTVFEDRYLRFDRYRAQTMLATFLMAVSICYGLWIASVYDPAQAENKVLILGSYGFFAVSVVGLLALAHWLVDVQWQYKTFYFLTCLHYSMFIHTVVYMDLMTSPYEAVGSSVFRFKDLWQMPAIMGVTWPIIYALVLRVARGLILRIDPKLGARATGYIGVMIVLYLASLAALSDFSFSMGIDSGSKYATLLAITFTSNLIYWGLFGELRLSATKNTLEGQLRTFDEQYRAINKSIEESRKFHSDIRHHLAVISVLNREGKYEEMGEYLKKYSTAYAATDRMALSGYPAVDNILQYYAGRAMEDGIRVESDVKSIHGDPDFDVMDMTVLLGNLFENAIEASNIGGASGEQEKYIKMILRQMGGSLLIQEENNCTVEEKNTDGFTDRTAFVSQKKAIIHGQGMKSIAMVAERYGGSAEFKRQDGVFQARIVLNMPTAKRKSRGGGGSEVED